jgi:hypothetical protein
MPKHYVTLGQQHTHRVNGITVDCDCVVQYNADTAEEGRAKAFKYFGEKFFTDYHDTQFDMESLEYFPRGIVAIE